jgi:hypothetical protein
MAMLQGLVVVFAAISVSMGCDAVDTVRHRVLSRQVWA